MPRTLKGVLESAAIYWAADEQGRSDILDFHRGNGIGQLRQSALKDSDGTPTSYDIQQWYDEG